MLDRIKNLGPKETFSDLWRDNFLQAMSNLACQTVHRLNLELYSHALLKRGLKVRKVKDDREECEMLERAMEYARVVGVELADMLTAVHEKVWALELWVPAQHTFRGDSLQNFIRDHQDQLEQMEGQLGDLMTMMNQVVERLMICSESYRRDLCCVEEINVQLLRWVLALEHGQENPIIIPGSSEPIPVPPPRILGPGSVLVEIDDGVDDAWNQVIVEDQAERAVR